MSEMIKLCKQELQTVKNILSDHAPELDVLIFGSRANGNSHEHSDLDIALRGAHKLDILFLATLKDEFQESDLPFRVDIIDFHRVSPAFQKVILETCEALDV